jgi:hypothetical protein
LIFADPNITQFEIFKEKGQDFMITFPFDQVLPKDECDRLFSAEEISKGGLPVFKLRKELPFGFKRDLSCVGNQVSL